MRPANEGFLTGGVETAMVGFSGREKNQQKVS